MDKELNNLKKKIKRLSILAFLLMIIQVINYLEFYKTNEVLSNIIIDNHMYSINRDARIERAIISGNKKELFFKSIRDNK
jgi:hypothetical protein